VSAFVAALFEDNRPITEITVHIVGLLIIARFNSINGVDGRWRCGIMHFS